MRELYALTDLEFDTGLAFLVAPLGALLGDVLERLKVTDFFSAEEADTTTYSLVLAVKESLSEEVTLPAFDDDAATWQRPVGSPSEKIDEG